MDVEYAYTMLQDAKIDLYNPSINASIDGYVCMCGSIHVYIQCVIKPSIMHVIVYLEQRNACHDDTTNTQKNENQPRTHKTHENNIVSTIDSDSTIEYQSPQNLIH